MTDATESTDWLQAVHEAATRIADCVRETPCESSPSLSAAGGGRVQLKLENQQRTGSFKLRGASNKILGLPPAARARGVIAASSGNHGLGVADAAARADATALVFVPDATPAYKCEAIAARGATVRRAGTDCVETEAIARRHAEAEGATYVSPYNDRAVIAGQGTVGLELHRQLQRLDAVFVALGGGGLISGIGIALRALRPDCDIIACSPAASPVMHASLTAGHIIEMPTDATLSDSTAGGVEPGSITFDLCRKVIHRSVTVDEDQIATAMRWMIERDHQLVEGAAGVAVAGYQSLADEYRDADVAIVLCGANIGLDALRQVL